MAKIIIGLTGLPSSGKGTATAYLVDHYGAVSFRFSTMLRDVLKRLYVEQTRDTMSRVSRVLRQQFGEDLMAKVLARDAETATASLVVVEGIRRQMDLTHLRTLPEFKLVAIEAEEEVRYQRLLTRGENEDDARKTREEFRADHLLETEASIPPLLAQADFHLDNNGDLTSLKLQLDALLEKLHYEG